MGLCLCASNSWQIPRVRFGDSRWVFLRTGKKVNSIKIHISIFSEFPSRARTVGVSFVGGRNEDWVGSAEGGRLNGGQGENFFHHFIEKKTFLFKIEILIIPSEKESQSENKMKILFLFNYRSIRCSTQIHWICSRIWSSNSAMSISSSRYAARQETGRSFSKINWIKFDNFQKYLILIGYNALSDPSQKTIDDAKMVIFECFPRGVIN